MSASARVWAAAAGLAVTAVAAANSTASLVGVFYDDGIYLALAKSVAGGHGYVLPYLPGSPGAVTYPFGYPLFLAALWKLDPSFPANVALFKAANAVLLGLFATLLVLYLRGRFALAPWRLALVVTAAATALPLIAVATVLFAEPLFLVLLVSACWAGDAARDAGSRRRAWGLAVLAGLLAGAAALTRSVGIAAVFGVAVSLLLVRRPRAALVALAVSAACLAPWMAWAARHHHDVDPILAANYGTYADLVAQAGWGWFSPGSVRDLLGPLAAVALAPFHDWLRFYLGVPALLLAAVGFGALLARASALGWSLLVYLGIVLLWPYGPDRFLWAAWPLLAVAFVAGVRRSWERFAAAAPPFSRIGRWCVAAAVAVVLAGYGFFQVRGYARGDALALQRGISAAMSGILPFVRETPPDAVVAGEDEALLWLYTGRRAVPNYVWRHTGRGGESLGPDSLRAWFDRAGVTHVVLSGPRSDAAPTINELLGRSPGYLRLVRVLPGSALAFAVDRGGRSATPGGGAK